MILTEQNYYSQEADLLYCSASQFKNFYGCQGLDGCEAMAMAKIKGKWTEETTPAMLIGEYVDVHFFGGEGPKLTAANTKKADKMIARIEKDRFFMQTLAGEHQKIIIANFFGLAWKIKIDNYIPEKAIVDLKTTANIVATTSWNKTFTKKLDFIAAYGYDIQGAIYQKVEGNNLPFFISVVSKEAEPDIEVFQISQNKLDEALEYVESMSERLRLVKEGKENPVRCERCDYCRSTKVLTAPKIWRP